MRIVAISDTHTFHQELDMPEGDVLVHSGDMTHRGRISEMKDFLEWFAGLPYKTKIFCNGNHEVEVSRLGNLTRLLVAEFNKYHFGNITYLEDEGITVDGLNFWASPYNLEFGYGWAYNYPASDGERTWAKIPDNTDVLITHGPPYGHGDVVEETLAGRARGHLGCKSLIARVEEVKPKVHIFGHIHSGEKVTRNEDTLFINASNCTEQYDCSNPPIVIDTETWEVVK